MGLYHINQSKIMYFISRIGCSPFVPPGEICVEPRSDTFTLYSDLGGVTEAAWFPTAATAEEDMEEGPSMDCCKGSTPMESQAAAAVEAAAAA